MHGTTGHVEEGQAGTRVVRGHVEEGQTGTRVIRGHVEEVCFVWTRVGA